MFFRHLTYKNRCVLRLQRFQYFMSIFKFCSQESYVRGDIKSSTNLFFSWIRHINHIFCVLLRKGRLVPLPVTEDINYSPYGNISSTALSTDILINIPNLYGRTHTLFKLRKCFVIQESIFLSFLMKRGRRKGI